MKSYQLVLLTLCVVGAFARPDGEESDGPPPEHAEKHKKHMECAQETRNLTECCPMPKFEELKNDPECKVHLEGIDEKDHKGKMKAGVCFMECIFKSKGLIEDKDVKWDKIKELAGEDPDFKEVSEKAVDFCEAKGELATIFPQQFQMTSSNHQGNEAKEKFKNHKGGHHHKGGPPKDGEKRCGFIPAMVSGCIKGYIVRVR
jgi:hypothetical protein